MSDLIYLNERQLLEVQELVNQLEEDLKCASQADNPVGLVYIQAELDVAREVLDRCLLHLPYQLEH